MKTLIIRLFVILPCMLLLGSAIGHAQGCRLDFTPNYDIYESISTNGTNIYTSVLVDGSTSGSGSAACNPNNVTHTPKAYNTIGTTGGWLSGSPGHMNSYSTVQNNQDVPIGSDPTINFDAEGEIICSEFGTFWSGGFPAKNVRIANAYWTDGTETPDGNCVYHKLACVSGKATCTLGGGVSAGAGCFSYLYSQTLVIDGVCDYPGIDAPAKGPGPCN